MWQPNKLEEERLSKAQQLENAGVELYPPRTERTHTAQAAIRIYEEGAELTEAGETTVDVSVAGRIRRLNVKGKVSFMHIEDETGRIQLFLRINDMPDQMYDIVAEKLVDVDDFVQARGPVMRTRAGEVSIAVRELTLLAKSLSPLPVVKQQVLEDGTTREYGEFSDKETRYRQRYADLAVNHDVRAVFRKRARIIRAMRDFLDSEGMLEVETPILQAIYGGAAARPFITHHNQLKQDLYLRISFELYLKRLLVGGFDAVYEIGRDFRNEGVSYKHNPEFTMMEFYKAYTDYRGVMDITERLIASIAQEALGTTTITYQDRTIDLKPPWRRLTIREAVQEYAGIDYMDYPTPETLGALLRERFGDEIGPNEPWGYMVVERLLGNHVEPHLVEPTFILDFPREISPFAKRVAGNDQLVERFELYIAGMEIANAFTELNDPRDQQIRFEEMARLYRAGDEDETPLDEDYLRAMRYGMPPNGGCGVGVDRLVMLLTDQRSIRDVLLYPHLRDER